MEENKVETLDDAPAVESLDSTPAPEKLDEPATEAPAPVVEAEPVTEAPTVVVETPTEAPAPELVTEAPKVEETPTEPVTEATKEEPATEAAPAPAPAEQKKKGKGGVLLILLILVLVIFAVWFFVLGGNEMLGLKKAEEEPQQEEKEESKQEENSNKEVELADSDSATKDRMEKFIFIVSDFGYDYSMITEMLPKFVAGKKGLTDSEKAKIALYTLNKDRSYASVSELPEKYKDKEADIDVMVSLSFEQYENAYKDLFVDSANIDEEVLKNANSCPFVDFIDSDSKTIYMREACGGTISADFGAHQVVIDRYTKQGNVYRAYTTYTVEYPDSSKNSTSKITWTFDKDGKFVETVVTE